MLKLSWFRLLRLFALVLLLGFTSVQSADVFADEVPVASAYPNTTEGVKALLSEFLKPGADHQALSLRFRPTPEEYLVVFEPEFAKQAQAFYDKAWDEGKMVLDFDNDQTEILVYSATTGELKAWAPKDVVYNFPGGFQRIAEKLNDGLTVYVFKFLKPGETSGMSHNGLVYVNGQWRWFPKPWRIAK